MFYAFKGRLVPIEAIRHAKTYIQKHLSPVLAIQEISFGVTPVWARCCKGARSLHINEVILADAKETKRIVRDYEENMP